uniref:CTP synthase (glutamine hydrolyzing) n=1 Tax=Chaetoceros debilis TaxID=122233 RepID=A0A7S3V5J1_9STRA
MKYLFFFFTFLAFVDAGIYQQGSANVTPRSSLLNIRGGDTVPSQLRELVDDAVSANRKIIVVTGGVLSGIGKGVTASSIGVLLRAMGLRVTALKIDPYLNVDAGTMSPFEHGEVFVLDDGGETDLDLGNYERFLSVSLTKESNLSTGKIYQSVIDRERMGDYLGKTVQVVPHISDAIQEWILRVAKAPVARFGASKKETPEVCIIELGGTLGDIESMPFVEALRQLQIQVGYKNMCFVHVSLVPVLGSPPEQKTKPTQHSVAQMRQLGLNPDFIACRGKEPIEPSAKRKIAMFSSTPENAIISIHDVSNIYRVPLMMMEQNLSSMLAHRLRIKPFCLKSNTKKYSAFENDDITGISKSDLIKKWTALADSVDSPEGECVIAMVGKYVSQGDACKYSMFKAVTINSRLVFVQKIMFYLPYFQ